MVTFLKIKEGDKRWTVEIVEERRKKAAEEKNKEEHKDEISMAEDKGATMEAESSKELKETSSS